MSPNTPIFTPNPDQTPTPGATLPETPISTQTPTPDPAPAESSAPILSAPAPNLPTSSAPKSASRVLLAGVIAAVALVASGIFFQLNRQSTTPSGASISSLEQGISDLDAQISRLSAEDAEIFKSTGFSPEFYQSSSRRTDLELQKADLEHERDLALADAASANIFRTGAFYFFLAAALFLIISITISLRLRRNRLGSASVIA